MAVTVEPKSSHVADESLRPFLQPTFDPAEYLNATLPALHLPTHAALPKPQNVVSLADLSSQTQTLLSQLNAQATRLTNLLTQLTDEILRSGSRLSYEVDVLRGETTALHETLHETLKAETALFVASEPPAAQPQNGEGASSLASEPAAAAAAAVPEPEYITRLRTLGAVRARLDAVIRTFNAAMQWPCPAAEGLAAGLVSVADAEGERRAAKAREIADALRAEVVGAVVDAVEPREGYEVAQRRIAELRELAGVFKGTAEERSRIKFVEGLERIASEKLREVETKGYGGDGLGRSGTPLSRTGVERIGTPSRLAEKGVGWLDNLGRIRNA